MSFENPPKNIESLIAKSADLTNKPFVHSVVKINGEYEFEEEDIDLTVNILCRDKEGKRLEIYDLELELFKSNKELVLVSLSLTSLMNQYYGVELKHYGWTAIMGKNVIHQNTALDWKI